MAWWQWVLIAVAVLVVVLVFTGVPDVKRYLRTRRM